MIRRVCISVSAVTVAVFGISWIERAAAATSPVQLLVPQGTAFLVLGHDCGSIAEHAYATGFDTTLDPAAGYPTGDVFLTTTCSAGKGTITTYKAWTSDTWDTDGALLSYSVLSGTPTVDPSFSATDPTSGNQLYNTTNFRCTSQTGTVPNACLQLAPSFTPRPRTTGISPTFGPAGGGTTVTISGDAFTGATAVNFGTTAAASFAVNNDTSITAVAPLVSPAGNPDTVDVTVVSPGGTSFTSTHDQFTFYRQPSVTGVSPNSGPVTGDYTITVTGTNFTGTTSVMFGDVAGGFQVTNDATLSVFVPPSDSPPGDNLDITVTSPGGTSPITPADQFTYTSSATASVSPTSGPPGTLVRVSGRGFRPGETVRVRYVTGLAAPKPASIALCSGVATVSGTFTCKGTIQKVNTGAKGFHTIIATGSASLTRASTTFNVT